MKNHDIIILGGGPGGSTLAAYLARRGFDVAIIERERFPRFHIGESLLPASMPIFKETGFYDKLASGKYIQKFGARFIDHHTDDEVYFGFEGGLNRDIPMAFEVERSELDTDLLEHAKSCGATVYQPERAKGFEFHSTGAKVTTNLGEYACKYLVDATGRDALLGKNFKMRSVNTDLNNVAVFSHFTGVKRHEGKNEGDITIGLLPENAWTWVIPFKGERTSVGVVCSSSKFALQGAADLGDYLDRMVSSSARLREAMKDADRCNEVSVVSNYSHTTETITGDRWLMIGDAAVFLDPIFSSGVHVSISSARLAANVLTQCMRSGCGIRDNGIGQLYQEELMKGVNRFHSLISLFYKTNFVESMKKTITLTNMREAFTSAVAGDMWNDENFLFKMKVLG